MCGLLTVVDFRGSCAAEPLMRSVMRVVVKTYPNPVLEVSLHRRFELAELELTFQAAPESFEEGNRTGFSDGAKPGENAERSHRVLKKRCYKLRALVRDEDVSPPVLSQLPRPPLLPGPRWVPWRTHATKGASISSSWESRLFQTGCDDSSKSSISIDQNFKPTSSSQTWKFCFSSETVWLLFATSSRCTSMIPPESSR